MATARPDALHGTFTDRASMPRALRRASVSPHHATSGSVNTTAGIARGSNAAGCPAAASAATRPSAIALCASIGSPATSPMANIARVRRAPLGVDHDEAARVPLRVGVLETEIVREGRRPHGHQHLVDLEALRRALAGQLHRDGAARLAHGRQLGPEQDLLEPLPEPARQRRCQIPIDPRAGCRPGAPRP